MKSNGLNPNGGEAKIRNKNADWSLGAALLFVVLNWTLGEHALPLGLVGIIPIMALPIVAIVLGYMGLKQIRESGQSGRASAIAGIVIGVIGVCLFLFGLLYGFSARN